MITQIGDSLHEPYMIMQQEYRAGAVESYEIEGHTFYYPLEQGQIGYEHFPGAPHKRMDVGMRGKTIKEGFYRTQE